MSEHLNVGDVTGPRWAGGTRNPDDAETTYATGPVDWELTAEMFKADNLALREQLTAQSRKLAEAAPELHTLRGEHDALIEQARFYSDGGPLGTNSPAAKRFGLLANAIEVLREQLAAAEAVIEKVRALPRQRVGIYLSGSPWYVPAENLDAALSDAPSSVLAAAKADAWDEGARYVTHDSTYTEMFDIPKNPYRRTGDTNA